MDSAYIKFNGGIWSEVLKGRYDLGNYKSAARTCENFIPTRYGQVEKRSGTKHLGFAKYDDKACVLHPFQFSVNTKFILEFGEQYIRFWSNDLQVETAPDTPLEVSTNYLEDELYELQIRAVNDVVYIVHPNHPVGKLTRLADDNWTYAAAELELPFVDPDINSTVVTLTPSATTGNGVTITASSAAFDAAHVGSILRLKHLSETDTTSTYDRNIPIDDVFDPAIGYAVGDTVEGGGFGTPSRKNLYTCHTTYPAGFTASLTPPAAYFSDGIIAINNKPASGKWSFKTSGIWNGTWRLDRSVDGGSNWATIKVLNSANDANYLVEEDEEGEEALIRVVATAIDFTALQNALVELTIFSTSVYGTAEVLTVAGNGLSVTADIIDDFYSTDPSASWQESGFSERQGYPRALSLFDNRLVFAGTKKKPQAFFYSEINSYDNLTATTTLADAPFFVETLSEDQSAVQWVTAQRELFVGTASVEGVLTTRKQDEAQSAENLPIIRWNESMGSAHRPALPLRDSLLTLQRGRTTLNMISYSLDKDGYTGEEVSLLCPHLFSSGVLQMAHLREPYTGAFTAQEDGTLCHMIYEPKLEVTGWCKYTTYRGEFKSVAVLPSAGNEGTEGDDVWVSVQRPDPTPDSLFSSWTPNSGWLVGNERSNLGKNYICQTTHQGSDNFEDDLAAGLWKQTVVTHIERFVTGNTERQEVNDADNMWYLDSALKFTGLGLRTITGLDHLEGETVCVLADGIKGSYIVSAGSITLDVDANTVIVGIPITSEFEPFDLEAEGSFGKRKQLYDSKLMVWRSLGGSVAHDGQDYQELIYHTAGELMDSALPLKDGWIEVFHESSYARQKYWRVKHDEPFPFTLQAVIQSFTVSKS